MNIHLRFLTEKVVIVRLFFQANDRHVYGFLVLNENNVKTKSFKFCSYLVLVEGS